MTPEILSLSGFAKLQGVRPSYITKLKDAGRLVLTEEGKVRVAESIELIAQTAGGRIDVAARHAEVRVRKIWNMSDCFALRLRNENGESIAEIARDLGVSPQRVKQVINKTFRDASDVLGGLSTRTRNCLKASGLSSFTDIEGAFNDGRLFEIPNFGEKSWLEVSEWLEEKKIERTDDTGNEDAARDAGDEKTAFDSQREGSAGKTRQNAKGEGNERLIDAKLRKESAQADQEEMKAAQMRGDLIPREEVDAAMKFIGGAVRAALEVFPDQTAPLVAPISDLTEINEVLAQACRDALHGIGEAIERQKKDMERGAA